MTEARVDARSDGGVAVVRVEGEIDIANAADVFEAVVAGAHGTVDVVLDLTGLGFMDSEGIALIERLGARLQSAGGRLAIVAPRTTPPRRVLDIVDLGRPVFDEVESALGSFGIDGSASTAYSG